jgi:hypothetical protein
MNRDSATGARMDALLDGVSAPIGTSADEPEILSSVLETQNPA